MPKKAMDILTESMFYVLMAFSKGRKRTYSITDKGISAYEQEVERLRMCVRDAEDAADEM